MGWVVFFGETLACAVRKLEESKNKFGWWERWRYDAAASWQRTSFGKKLQCGESTVSCGIRVVVVVVAVFVQGFPSSSFAAILTQRFDAMK